MPFSEYDPDRTGQTPSTRDDLIMFLNERGVTEADIDRVALQVSVDVLFDLERLGNGAIINSEARAALRDHSRRTGAAPRATGEAGGFRGYGNAKGSRWRDSRRLAD